MFNEMDNNPLGFGTPETPQQLKCTRCNNLLPKSFVPDDGAEVLCARCAAKEAEAIIAPPEVPVMETPIEPEIVVPDELPVLQESETIVQNEETLPEDTLPDLSYEAMVKAKKLNARISPHSGGAVKKVLEQGDIVVIEKEETFESKLWGYVKDLGLWVMVDFLEKA